jgi:hypothetical protein
MSILQKCQICQGEIIMNHFQIRSVKPVSAAETPLCLHGRGNPSSSLSWDVRCR